MDNADDIEISVVIPVFNEEGALPTLLAEVMTAMDGTRRFEVIVVDDASTDQGPAIVADLARTEPRLRLLQNTVNAGQSASVHNGVLAARGPIVCTLDGDGQNPPVHLPELADALQSAPVGTALVAGQRVNRKDSLSKRFASGFANRLRAAVLHDATRDTGCGLKAFDRAAFLALPYFDHMHRYLPALMTRAGYAVIHIDVTHRPREAGTSKYTNLGRALKGIVDLAGVAWLIRRRKRATATEFPRQ